MLHSSPPILYHALLLLSSLPHPIYSIHRSISTHGYVWSIIILYRIEVVYKCKVFLPFHTDGYWQDISIPFLFRIATLQFSFCTWIIVLYLDYHVYSSQLFLCTFVHLMIISRQIGIWGYLGIGRHCFRLQYNSKRIFSISICNFLNLKHVVDLLLFSGWC